MFFFLFIDALVEIPTFLLCHFIWVWVIKSDKSMKVWKILDSLASLFRHLLTSVRGALRRRSYSRNLRGHSYHTSPRTHERASAHQTYDCHSFCNIGKLQQTRGSVETISYYCFFVLLLTSLTVCCLLSWLGQGLYNYYCKICVIMFCSYKMHEVNELTPFWWIIQLFHRLACWTNNIQHLPF